MIGHPHRSAHAGIHSHDPVGGDGVFSFPTRSSHSFRWLTPNLSGEGLP